MRHLPSYLIVLSLASAPALVAAAEAHVHGRAQLNVAIDGNTLTLMLESPTDSLVGFERAPSSDADQAAVAQMKEALEEADKLFLPTPGAGCELESVELHSLLLGDATESGHEDQVDHDHGDHDHGDRADHAHQEGHADLNGDFAFHCAHPERLHDLEVRLFDAFPRLERVKVAVVAPDGQKAAELTARENRITW